VRARLLDQRIGYAVAISGIGLVTALLRLSASVSEHVNATTVALSLLLIVLLTATGWGSRPAVVASVLGMLCFNFFFLPPVGTWTIAEPDNWIALFAFVATAVVTGQLSARVKRRAEEAEAGRREIERLYRELQEAFERASEAEALRRSEQLKSALLDAVTHDLRTPLTAIKASVTTLLEEQRQPVSGADNLQLTAEDRREMMDVIDEEADRLNHFIESMVELARIEAGALALQRRWGDVEEIVAAALQRAERLTQAHCLEVALEPELPLVRADAKALAEVLYTLLDNACKYSPIGACVRISADRVAQDEMIQFTVADQGPGIPPALRGKVFDKFFRATPEAKKLRAGGYGMGLAIARGIVEAHGGSIWFEDGAEGRGTRVHFTVPIGGAEPDKAEH
jgi:K+-sensing histidine kinase KdpD